jgi:alcohol-forming fatty acyl-CoA reductase
MTPNADTHQDQGLDLRRILAGKRILLTGATGFLAKVVLEKIIRQVPDIGGVTLLIRGNAQERFVREVAASSIFDALRAERPAALAECLAQRVHCVSGDITRSGFGLTPAAFIALAGRTDVIINAAASVDFREPLDVALAINTRSLHQLTALARASGAPLIQVSTCYVHGYLQGDIHETVASPAGTAIPRHRDGGYDVDVLCKRLERGIERIHASCDDPQRRRERLTEFGIREANRLGWNDTYTFTKWLGEQVAMRGMAGRALTIVRPSIIESTLHSPVPGWIEGVKVADAVILAYARGKTSFFPALPRQVIDIIPADLVASSILMATAEALASLPSHRIYQCCSGSSNPLLLGDMIRLLQVEARRHWQSYDRLFLREPTHTFRVVGHHSFRALLGTMRCAAVAWNGLRRLTGSGDAPALEALRTTHTLALTFSFYTRPRYRFQSSRLLALANRFSETDRRLFPVDASLIHWEDYLCRVHMAGLNRYALRRRPANSTNATNATSAAITAAQVENTGTPLGHQQGHAPALSIDKY